MRRTRLVRASMLGVAIGVAALAAAEDIDPAGDGSQYVWSENAGWINAEPLGNGGPGVQVDDFGLWGWMWGENVGWVGLSCLGTASCGTTGYGVTNDGSGALSGYAWSENGGWISFSCATTGSCGTKAYGVGIDPATGTFSGRAWSENLGWITFASTGPNPFALKTSWCASVASAPSGSPGLRADSKTSWSWSVVSSAGWYEFVRGDLTALRANAGSFAVSTAECVADNQTALTTAYALDPAAGSGFWFLVRGANCKGKGSFDSGAGSQSAPRDAGIASSGNDCP